MNLKTLTTILLISSSSPDYETQYYYLNEAYRVIHKLNNIEFQGLRLDIKRKGVFFPRNRIYLEFNKDHNNKPIYFLTYKFNPKEVQLLFRTSRDYHKRQ